MIFLGKGDKLYLLDSNENIFTKLDIERIIFDADNVFFILKGKGKSIKANSKLLGKKLFLTTNDYFYKRKYDLVIKDNFVLVTIIDNPSITNLDASKEINKVFSNVTSSGLNKLRYLKLRDVNRLYHFTSISNLNGILSNGLQPVNNLKQNNLNYDFNDFNRHDNSKGRISMTFTKPNVRVLKEFKQSKRICIIEFDERLIKYLIENNYVKFCEYNAARKDCIKGKGIKDLIRMFKDDGIYDRNPNTSFAKILPRDRNSDLAINLPSQDQAEILVYAWIDCSMINKIYFEFDEDYIENKNLLEKFNIKGEVNPRIFY